MRLSNRALITILLIGHAATGWPYPWDKDMVDQPAEKPQKSLAPAEPQSSVPTRGGETVPAPTTERGMFDAKDAAVSVKNPVPATSESIARGKYFYDINCLVCHGETGVGDGPVGQKFVDPTPVDLNDAYTQDQADGQIFFHPDSRKSCHAVLSRLTEPE